MNLDNIKIPTKEELEKDHLYDWYNVENGLEATYSILISEFFGDNIPKLFSEMIELDEPLDPDEESYWDRFNIVLGIINMGFEEDFEDSKVKVRISLEDGDLLILLNKESEV